jgi:hypothetical protein
MASRSVASKESRFFCCCIMDLFSLFVEKTHLVCLLFISYIIFLHCQDEKQRRSKDGKHARELFKYNSQCFHNHGKNFDLSSHPVLAYPSIRPIHASVQLLFLEARVRTRVFVRVRTHARAQVRVCVQVCTRGRGQARVCWRGFERLCLRCDCARVYFIVLERAEGPEPLKRAARKSAAWQWTLFVCFSCASRGQLAFLVHCGDSSGLLHSPSPHSYILNIFFRARALRERYVRRPVLQRQCVFSLRGGLLLCSHGRLLRFRLSALSQGRICLHNQLAASLRRLAGLRPAGAASGECAAQPAGRLHVEQSLKAAIGPWRRWLGVQPKGKALFGCRSAHVFPQH